MNLPAGQGLNPWVLQRQMEIRRDAKLAESRKGDSEGFSFTKANAQKNKANLQSQMLACRALKNKATLQAQMLARRSEKNKATLQDQMRKRVESKRLQRSAERMRRAYEISEGPCAYRYTDRPRKGAIWRLPDDDRIRRGPTLVILPSGRQIRVPNFLKNQVVAPSMTHEKQYGDEMTELLKSLVKGERLPGDHPNRQMINFDRRPNFFTRQADMGDGSIAHF